MTKAFELKFESSPNISAFKYLLTSQNIYNNFYNKRSLYILPYLIENNYSIIHYPKINHKIKNFWNLANAQPKDLLNQSNNLVNKLTQFFEEIDYSKHEEKFRSEFKKMWIELNKLAPELLKDIKKIEIYPTEIGSICSQYSHFLDDPSVVKIYPRIDCSNREFFKMIIFERLLRSNNKTKYQWSEIMAISEFIINDLSLPFKDQSKKYTLFASRDKKDGKLYKESLDYLKELGFTFVNSLNIRQGEVYWEDRFLKLTESEKNFLTALIDSQQEIASFDKIAQYLWQEDYIDKFSLEAITQIAKRVRKKLNAQGIRANIVKSVQGKGYILSEKFSKK